MCSLYFDRLNEFHDVSPLQLHHIDNLAALLITMFEVIYSFGILFIACELCQRVDFAFSECNVMIDQFAWYSVPADVQRMLPLILNFMQQPIELKCFGSSSCDRETFKYVRLTTTRHCHSSHDKFFYHWKLYFQIVKTAFSYFTILRKFND